MHEKSLRHQCCMTKTLEKVCKIKKKRDRIYENRAREGKFHELGAKLERLEGICSEGLAKKRTN